MLCSKILLISLFNFKHKIGYSFEVLVTYVISSSNNINWSYPNSPSLPRLMRSRSSTRCRLHSTASAWREILLRKLRIFTFSASLLCRPFCFFYTIWARTFYMWHKINRYLRVLHGVALLELLQDVVPTPPQTLLPT